MGNRLSRRRETPASTHETVAAEENTTKEPGNDSAVTETHEAAKTEDLDVVVGEPVTPVACLPNEECVAEFKEAEASSASALKNDTEPAPVVKEAPVQPEPQVSASTPSPSEPAAEAELAPDSEPDIEIVQPISEPAPASVEHLENQADQLTQESLHELVLSSPPLTDSGPPDFVPSQDPNPVPVNPDEPADLPAGEERQDGDEAADNSTLEPEKPTEAHLEKPMEVEAEESLEKLGSDVNEESVSETPKNSELRGNDLVSDLIPRDVNVPDDTPITDMSTSTELM